MRLPSRLPFAVLLLGGCTWVSDAEWQERLAGSCTPTPWYTDADGDGYGTDSVEACDAPDGTTATPGDCDDADADVHPGATEVWYDGVDGDCDGADDFDADGDGWDVDEDCMDRADDPIPALEGDCEGPTTTPDPATVHPEAVDMVGDGVDSDCSGGTDFDADLDGWPGCDDCDDADNSVNPDATEVWYDGVDQDCDGNDDDQDADGYGVDVDCDDLDPSRSPGTPEIWYDGVDQNCDGDDQDQDGDGYDLAVDCSDTNAAIHPGATELWYNGVDEDCDGQDNDQDADGVDWPADCDDTDPSVKPGATEVPGDGVDENCDGNDSNDDDGDGWDVVVDCDDTDATIHPDATELPADGVDQDCDGFELCHPDLDDDGYGDAATTPSADLACTSPGVVVDDTDCDDADGAAYPGAAEVPVDGVDEDCDGLEDCRPDADHDGAGGTGTLQSSDLSCTTVGVTTTADDCDDADPARSPTATELVADDVDEDCDGHELCYADADADGDGAATLVSAPSTTCAAPGYSHDGEDCDDTDPAIHPGASESAADGVDQDCDGYEACFPDADADGYGGATLVLSADPTCSSPGETPTGTDCDDAVAAVHPGAAETPADGVDQDCDGQEVCWRDLDGDGHGGTSLTFSASVTCAAVGVAAVSDDCDDTRPGTHPGATELAGDGIDEDCDGNESCYTDVDGDGYGGTLGVTASLTCSEAGYTTAGGDCDDGDAAVNPAATETPADDTDQDCDGYELCYLDDDGDGYGTSTPEPSTSISCVGSSTITTDCDDSRTEVHPGATEVTADGLDEDCDGYETCYVDSDADGYGTSSTIVSTTTSCTGAGLATLATDCNDGASTVHPGSTEVVADGVDENCDGMESCYQDADHDGYGGTTTTNSSTLSCTAYGSASSSTDCDDAAGAVHPGATEVLNDHVDENCDGLEACYADADGDGQGTTSTTLSASLTCTGTGVSTTSGDCDDSSATVYLGAPELCDGEANDCATMSSWLAASENNLVHFESTSGVWTNMSASFAAGSAASPVTVRPGASGTYHLCSRTTDSAWYAAIETTGKTITLEGVASAGSIPVLSINHHTGSVLVATDASMSVSYVKLIGGTGSGGSSYGGVFYGNDSATTGTAYSWTFTDAILTGGNTYEGGAAFVGGNSSLSLVDTVVDANTASWGGGVYLDSTGTATCSGSSSFSGNTAYYLGAAVYFGTVDTLSKFTASSCDFVANNAESYWGPPYTEDIDGDAYSYPYIYSSSYDVSFTCTYLGCY